MPVTGTRGAGVCFSAPFRLPGSQHSDPGIAPKKPEDLRVSSGKLLLFCLALAVLPAPCARIQSGAATAGPVTLYTDFREPVSQAVVEALRDEVDSIMAPMGLQFEWRPLADFHSERVSTAVAVAHFEARCDVSGLVMRKNQPGSLGWTEMSDGAILPFTHVDCERVRTFLQIALLGYRPRDRERAYGRALGRVLAHELYHVFCDTPKHAARGVAKEKYSVADLLGADFRFHEAETRDLRGSHAPAVLKALRGPV